MDIRMARGGPAMWLTLCPLLDRRGIWLRAFYGELLNTHATMRK